VTVGADLTLTVRDNGRGMAATGRRSGLANLEQRAHALGGTLSVGAADDGGTCLTWTVPVADSA
jgi:signal transduction histidine kinase